MCGYRLCRAEGDLTVRMCIKQFGSEVTNAGDGISSVTCACPSDFGFALASLFTLALFFIIGLTRRTRIKRADHDSSYVPPLVDAPSNDPNPYKPSRLVPSKGKQTFGSLITIIAAYHADVHGLVVTDSQVDQELVGTL
jgi:hypothetical protein